MSIYILVKWSLFQIKDRGETKNIANKHLFRLTAASCKPLSVNPRIKGMEIYDINTIYSKYKEFIDSNCTDLKDEVEMIVRRRG